MSPVTTVSPRLGDPSLLSQRHSAFRQAVSTRLSAHRSTARRAAPATVNIGRFGGGGGKTKGQAYICKDCGFIEVDFETQPEGYRCPVCNAPKRRFSPYKEPVAKNANSLATRKARKAELQAGGSGSGDGLNPAVLVGAGVAALAALYLVLNATL